MLCEGDVIGSDADNALPCIGFSFTTLTFFLIVARGLLFTSQAHLVIFVIQALDFGKEGEFESFFWYFNSSATALA